jgi:hypothetical protein
VGTDERWEDWPRTRKGRCESVALTAPTTTSALRPVRCLVWWSFLLRFG